MLSLALMLVAAPAADAGSFIRQTLKLERYRSASADLNGDGRHELIVYAEQPSQCGSGGCNLYVLSPQGRSYRVVTRMTVVRPPIRLLATASHGWRDLGVRVAGGGVRQGYAVRLRFDGRSYPRNPTVLPAQSNVHATGRTLLD
jgi:hypothetical protein